MLNDCSKSTSICHNLHDDISLINLNTFIAFSNSTWFMNETWFPMPADFYRDSLLKSIDDENNLQFEVEKDEYGKHQVGNYLNHYTKYDCDNRNLHKYKVIDFPIYANDHFSIAFLVNFSTLITEEHHPQSRDFKPHIFYCNSSDGISGHEIKYIATNIRFLMQDYCIYNNLQLNKKLNADSLPATEITEN